MKAKTPLQRESENFTGENASDRFLSLFLNPLLSSVQHEGENGERDGTAIMKIQYVLIFFVLFSVVMAAASEVSLCQVPVGLTPVFEADKVPKDTPRSLDVSVSHTVVGSLTHAEGH